ncbi:DUF3883 domain-containing protein [Microtetraspora sp. NBRC 16547]|uniref:protein NO VEIN domain-containing protein n=1 Tax=Microtetraspora sp. NBRC 16547 TaxID=3030993 RepID=UPI0024A24BD1|nr:DUF3883 domain-containing protein [Microtetraspora sp. NBRC 16547]GLW98211.1 hypothetical protein Misp02_22980 [Microtetraspora sp. NBRC 16547]
MPIDDDGRLLQAQYSVETDQPYLSLILESSSGAAPGRLKRNPDYIASLRLLLTRLQALGAVLQDALVDTQNTQRQQLPEAERRLIPSAIRLVGQDIEALRKTLTSAQGPVGQAAGAIKKGNNSKRIRLRLNVPGFTPAEANRLATTLATPLLLEGGSPERHGRRDHHDDAPVRDSPRHRRFLQDARLRRAIEEYAVTRATTYFENLGYTVEDVGASRSYDLHAARDTEELRIEVKGSTLCADSVELTLNEVNNADGELSVLVVVDQIARLDDGFEDPQLGGGRLRAWWPWKPAAEDLSPTRYLCQLPPMPTYEE